MALHLCPRHRRATIPSTRGTATDRIPASGRRPTVWKPKILLTATTRPAAARVLTVRQAPLRRPRPEAAQQVTTKSRSNAPLMTHRSSNVAFKRDFRDRTSVPKTRPKKRTPKITMQC